MDIWNLLLLPLAGLVAGFVDSIAGGGGLITVPLLSILLGPGAMAIGTNKIAAVVASLAALIIYLRAGHVRLRGNILFAIVTGFGAFFGAFIAPSVSSDVYRWLLVTICPVILWIVFHKDIWVRQKIEIHPNTLQFAPLEQFLRTRSTTILFLVCGAACGFYDGVAGPGGGTLMFLALFLVAKTPLLVAMATAKLANLASAGVSLSTYALTDHVVWSRGIPLAIGIGIGAVIGATLTSRTAASAKTSHRTALMARFALLIVASLLAARLAFQ